MEHKASAGLRAILPLAACVMEVTDAWLQLWVSCGKIALFVKSGGNKALMVDCSVAAQPCVRQHQQQVLGVRFS